MILAAMLSRKKDCVPLGSMGYPLLFAMKEEAGMKRKRTDSVAHLLSAPNVEGSGGVGSSAGIHEAMEENKEGQSSLRVSRELYAHHHADRGMGFQVCTLRGVNVWIGRMKIWIEDESKTYIGI
jgi:hypothetical protein